MELIEALNWRYATKQMTGEKVPQEKIDRILEATNLAATSLGLQPYNIIVIEDKEILKKIAPIANNQPQIEKASHLLVFAVWDKLTKERVQAYIDRIEEVRGPLHERMKSFTGYLFSFTEKDDDVNFKWMARQAYIALGTALVAAAVEKVDSTPMEGFDPEALDEVLGLKAKGLKSVLLLPLGYRDEENDYLVKMQKVRKPLENLIIKM